LATQKMKQKQNSRLFWLTEKMSKKLEVAR